MWTLLVFVIGISGQVNKAPDIVVTSLSQSLCTQQAEAIMTTRHDAIAVCKKE